MQNTDQGELTAAILPYATPLISSLRFDVDANLAWIYMGDLEKHPEPYLGIRLPLDPLSKVLEDGETLDVPSAIIPAAYLLFDLASLKDPRVALQVPAHPLPPIGVPWSDDYGLILSELIKGFAEAKDLLAKGILTPPQMLPSSVEKEIALEVQAKGGKLYTIPTDTLAASISKEAFMEHRLESVALRYTQISMIWALLAAFDTGLFGKDLFSPPAPLGLSIFSTEDRVGVAIATQDSCFPTPVFDDAGYFQTHIPQKTNLTIPPTFAIIDTPLDQEFLGNTVQFVIKSSKAARKGYLTLGIDANGPLQQLILAVHEMAFMVHDGKIQSSFAENGNRLSS